MVHVKIVLMGAPRAGKTALACAMSRQRPVPVEYDPTIGADFLRRELDDEYNLQFWDTAGDERFASITNAYIRGAHAVVLVFSLADASSFEALAQIHHDTLQRYDFDGALVVIGTHADVEPREVDSGVAEEFATSIGARYFEVEVVDGLDLDLHDVLRDALAATAKTMAIDSSAKVAIDMPATNAFMMPRSRVDGVFADLESTLMGAALMLFGGGAWLVRIVATTMMALCVVVVVLPYLFLLLVLRPTVVEVDSTASDSRRDLIDSESKGQRGLRLGTMLLRALPMSFFIYALPAVVFIGAGVAPTSTAGADFLAVYLGLLGLLQALGAVRACVSLRATNRDAPTTPEPPLLDARNALVVVTLVIEFVQLASYPQPPSDARSALLVEPTTDFREATAWASVGCVASVAAAFVVQFLLDLRTLEPGSGSPFFRTFLGAMIYGHGAQEGVSGAVVMLIETLCCTLFLTVSKVLIEIAVFPLPGDGIVTAALLSSLAFFVPVSSLVAPLFVAAPAPGRITFRAAYLQVATVAKFLLLASAAVAARMGSPVREAAAGTALATSLSLLAITALSMALSGVVNYPAAATAKIAIYACGSWSALLALVTPRPSVGLWLGGSAVILGAVVAVPVLLDRRRERKGGATQTQSSEMQEL